VQYVYVTFWENGFPNPSITMTGCLHLFYSENLGRSKIRIQKKSIKSNTHLSHQ
jgi:hypothetical protein